MLEYFLDGSFSKTLSTSAVYSTFSLLSKLCPAYCTRASFDFGKSIPDNTFATVAAEIDEDATAALPLLALGFSVFSISLALLGLFLLFSSPKAKGTASAG